MAELVLTHELEELKQRLLRNTKVDGECLLWTGARTTNGYGQIKFRGRLLHVNRASVMVHIGPIPEGMFACHHCDNPPCINPAHLYIGTASDNMQDKVRRGRCNMPRGDKHYARIAAMSRPPKVLPGKARGSRCWSAKITEADVSIIRECSRFLFQREIGEIFGLTQATVSKVILGATWKHATTQ